MELKDAFQKRYDIIPQMRAYDELPISWEPYVMMTSQPDFKSDVVNTDSFGLRLSALGEKLVSPLEKTNPAIDNFLLGGSAAFGIGATSDSKTIPSYLHQMGHGNWANLGGRALNSFQELIQFLLFFPDPARNVVLFSGVNDLYLSFLGRESSPVFSPMYLERLFVERMSLPQGIRAQIRYLKDMLKRKFFSPGSSSTPNYQPHNLFANLHRTFQVWSALSQSKNFKLTFVLQPLSTWTNKKFSSEEKLLFDLLDSVNQRSFKIWMEEMTRNKDQFQQELESLCSKFGVKFINMNRMPDFQKEEWLFVDRVHLTDRGNEICAQAISDLLRGDE